MGKREETVLKENKNESMKRYIETHHKDLITKGGIVEGTTLYKDFSDLSIANFAATLKSNFDVTEIKDGDLWLLNFQGILSQTDTLEDIEKAFTEFFEQHIQTCSQSILTFQNLKECFRKSKWYTNSRNKLLKEYTEKNTCKTWIPQKMINAKRYKNIIMGYKIVQDP